MRRFEDACYAVTTLARVTLAFVLGASALACTSLNSPGSSPEGRDGGDMLGDSGSSNLPRDRRDAETPVIDGGSTPIDGAPDPAVDAAADSGMDVTADAATSPECTQDADCGDVRVFACVERSCATRRVPQGSWLSGGGGVVRSSSFAARISVGTPSPFGRAVSNHYAVTIGAGAGRP